MPIPRSGRSIHPGQVSPDKEGLRVSSAVATAIGDLVYISTDDADSADDCPGVTAADSDVANAPAQYICKDAIVAGAQGRVVKGLTLGDVNTNGATVGDPVYLSATAGGWTLTLPVAADRRAQIVGRVKVVSATVGVIRFNLREGAHPIGRLPSSNLKNSLIQYAEVSLTNTNMLALRATPITMVAAPGAGFVIEFVSAELFFDYIAAYTETADNLAFRYTDGSGTIVSQAIEATGFVDATADTKTNALAKIDAISAKTACDNALLCLHNTGDGEYGGGNASNVVRVKVAYRIHAAGW